MEDPRPPRERRRPFTPEEWARVTRQIRQHLWRKAEAPSRCGFLVVDGVWVRVCR